MLYFETAPGAFVQWVGGILQNIRLPGNIGQLWTDRELAAFGLYRPVDPGVPSGKLATATTVERVDGVVTYVYTLVDAPTTDEIDQDTLNAALTAPGSVVRALALVMLGEVNKLRVQAGLTAYTQAQFLTALKAQMR